MSHICICFHPGRPRFVGTCGDRGLTLEQTFSPPAFKAPASDEPLTSTHPLWSYMSFLRKTDVSKHLARKPRIKLKSSSFVLPKEEASVFTAQDGRLSLPTLASPRR